MAKQGFLALLQKIGWIFSVFVGVVCIVAASLYFSEFPQDIAKFIAEKEMTKIFQKEVKIGAITGDLFTSATLHDVKIAEETTLEAGVLIHIHALTAHYSLLKGFRHRWDMSAASKKVFVNGMDIYLTRHLDDRWNLLHIFPPPTPGIEPNPPTFKGKMFVEGLTIHFKDRKGWGVEPLDTPFEDRFEHMTAELDFADLTKTPIHFKGQMGKNKKPVSFQGLFNNLNGQFDIDFTTQLDIDHWGPYVFPYESYVLGGEDPVISGHIRSKNPFPSDTIGFLYDVNVAFDNGSIKFPFFPVPLHSIDTTLTFSHGHLTKSHLTDFFPGDRKANYKAGLLWTFLRDINVIDETGQLVTWTTPTYTFTLADLPRALKSDLTTIQQQLKNPPASIYVSNLNGRLGDIPVTGDGVLYLTPGSMHLRAKSDGFQSDKIKQLFPALQGWKFTGLAQSDLVIEGAISNPDVVGNMTSKKQKVYGFYPENVVMEYNFFDKELNLNLTKGRLYNGPIIGQATLDFSQKFPTLTGKLVGEAQDFSTIFKTKFPHSNGLFNFELDIAGQTNDYKGNFVLKNYDKFNIWMQSIENAFIPFQVKDYKDIYVSTSNIMVKNSLVSGNTTESLEVGNINENYGVQFTGFIDDFMDAKFEYTGNFAFRDPDYRVGTPNESEALGLFLGGGTLEAQLTDKFWKKPMTQLSTHVSGTIQDGSVSGVPKISGTFALTYNRTDLDVHRLDMSNPKFNASLVGEWEAYKPQAMAMTLRKFDVGQAKILQEKVPAWMLPLDGDLDLDLEYERDKTSTAIFSLAQGQLQGEPIAKLNGEALWEDGVATIKRLSLEKEDSFVELSGTVDRAFNYDLTINPSTKLRLEDFSVVLSQYGDFSGFLAVNGHIQKKDMYTFSLSLDGKALKSRFFQLDELQGLLSYEGGKLEANPIKGQFEGNDYVFDGHLDLSPILNGDKIDLFGLDYDFSVSVQKGRLANVAALSESVYRELKVRSDEALAVSKKTPFSRSAVVHTKKNKPAAYELTYPDSKDSRVSLYKAGALPSRVQFFESIYKHHQASVTFQETGIKELFGGEFTGSIRAKSYANGSPDIQGEFYFSNANVAVLGGNKAHLKVNASHIERPWVLHTSFNMFDGDINGVDVKRMHVEADINTQGILSFEDTYIENNHGRSGQLVTGTFPLSDYWQKGVAGFTARPMNLDVTLDDVGVSLVAGLSPSLERVSNAGVIAVSVDGPISSPRLNTNKVVVKDAQLQFGDATIFKTPFEINNGYFSIKNNELRLPSINVTWQGEDTKGLGFDAVENKIVMDGRVGIEGLSFQKWVSMNLAIDLTMEDSHLKVSYPTLYNGHLYVKNGQLKGNYTVPLSKKEKQKSLNNIRTIKEKGPVLRADVLFENGEMILPTLGKRTNKPSIELEITANIQENIALEGGLFGEGFFQNVANSFSLDISPSQEPLLVSGTLNAPIIKRTVGIEDGQVNFINRSFDVLTPDEQKALFKEQKEKMSPNTVGFKTQKLGDSEKLRIIPIFDVNAATVIEPVTANITDTKAVVIAIDGSVFDLSSFLFDEYILNSPDSSRWDGVYKQTYALDGSQTQNNDVRFLAILKLLMPEIFDNPVISEQGINSPESQRLIREIGANRINAIIKREFLRKFEKDLATSIGLEDISIEYNVGEAIFDTLSGDDSTGSGLGINFVAQYFERLKLRVKTDLDPSEETRGIIDDHYLSEVELTFLLLKNLAIIYSNIKDDDDRKSKMSLEYSHEF